MSSSQALIDDLTVIELEKFLPYRLSILSNMVSGTIADAYAERFGLSIPEWRVMAVLARFPDSSAATVASRSLMDKVAVSRAVSRLLQRELIERKMAREDRRRSILNLSAKGWDVYEEIVPFALNYERELLGNFNEKEQETIDRVLSKLTEKAVALRNR